MADNALGEYLRARRELLRPSDLGLVETGPPRRVIGLRREEVAILAGISTDYYLRLEQGRDVSPSEQVIAALARALRLGPASEEFLHRIVRPLPDRGYAGRHNPESADRISAFVAALTTPAFAHDRVLDVIVSNGPARAISPSFVPGVNLITAAFLDPDLRRLYENWEEMTGRLVSYLRAQAVTPPLDPRLPALVDGLAERSSRFAELWARQEVGASSSGVNQLNHPLAGRLKLNFERVCFAGTDHPVILIYHADPGSQSQVALTTLLASTNATPD